MTTAKSAKSVKSQEPDAATAGKGRRAVRGDPRCSFCGKAHTEVRALVAGPGVYICDACVDLCNGILAELPSHSPIEGWKGWEPMSDEELLATLAGSLATAENVRDGVQARVDELRRRKVSWARIGEALQMSRQAAWERFA